jgi:hydroxyacylglutathione hydrolase
MIQIKRIVANNFQENCFLLHDPKSLEGCVVDPGGSIPEIISWLAEHKLTLKYILATHGHADHIAGVGELQMHHDLPLQLAEADNYLAEVLVEQAGMIGVYPVSELGKIEYFDPVQARFSLGSQEIKVIHTPGHTPGCVCFWVENSLLAGDTLFQQSVGRTDLPGGSMTALKRTLRALVAEIPPETLIYPGHGDETTMKEELQHNPWLDTILNKLY